MAKEDSNQEKLNVLKLTMDKLEKTYGKGTIMKLGDQAVEEMPTISTGSLGEVETHLMIAKDLGYLSESDYSALEEKRSETTRLLSGLIRSLS